MIKFYSEESKALQQHYNFSTLETSITMFAAAFYVVLTIFLLVN